MYSCTFASLTCRWPQLFFTASDDHQNQNVSHLVVSPRLGSLLSILFRLNTSRHCGDIFMVTDFGCRLCWCMIFGYIWHKHHKRLGDTSLTSSQTVQSESAAAVRSVYRSHLLISCRPPGWRMCHPLPLEAGTVRSWKRAMSVFFGAWIKSATSDCWNASWNPGNYPGRDHLVSASIVSWIQ